MKKNRKREFLQTVLKASVCLFLLSGTGYAMAQDTETADADSTAAPVAKKTVRLPQYPMKEISGTIFDAATKKPMGGVRVQALADDRYTAMTEDNGTYTIKVPTFVTALYISVPDYNAVQVAIKGEKNQNAQLTTTDFRSFYKNGTTVTSTKTANISESSAVTIEPEIENQLGGDIRTINRSGLPAQGAVMLIRGLNSLNANAQPLVILDGVMLDLQESRGSIHTGFFNNILAGIDVEDIDNVQVLKNGTAIYGAKGANGVILINTKRGHSLATRITARIYGGVEMKPNTIDVMNGNQFRNYATELAGTTKQFAEYPSTDMAFMNENPDYYFYPLFHNNTDWSDKLYREAFTQNYKVNVQGGDERAMYSLSLGYSQEDATMKKNDFSRLNIRFNTDIQLLPTLGTQLDIAYSRVYYNLRDNGWAEDYSQSTISSPNVLGLIQSPALSKYTYYTGNDLKLHLSSVYAGKYAATNTYDLVANPFSYASSLDATPLANPYWIMLNGDGAEKNNEELTQFNINVNPKWQVTKTFFLNNRFAYALNRSSEKYYLPKAGITPYTLEGLGTAYSQIKSQFTKEESAYEEFQLNWGNNYGAHTMKAFGGFRYTNYSYSDSYIGSFNIDNDKMPNMDTSNQFKTYGGANDKWTNLGYYANFDYNYKNKYFAQASASLETSSRFGTKTKGGFQMFGVSWGLFPSLQLGWLISSEPWFRTLKGVNYMKLTAGYERDGNDDIDYYAARTYYSSHSFLKTATALQLENIKSPEIQWETTDKLNIGLQTSVWNNRINMGVEYFYNKTKNMLGQRTISYLTGLKKYWNNDGEMKNEGFDVNANVILLNTKNWKWQIGASMGHYVNKVTKMSDNDIITLYSNHDQTAIAKTYNGYVRDIYGGESLVAVGEALGTFYGYKFAGVFSTDAQAKAAGNGTYLKYATGLSSDPYRNFKSGDAHFVDMNGDGIIDSNDKTKIGDANPDIYGNIYTNVTWKHLTLDVNFKYSLGNDVYNYQRSQLESETLFQNQSQAIVNRWTHEGQVTDVPRLCSTQSSSYVANERFSSRWIEDGSYLKLKKVRLTYKFPISNQWIQGLNLWGEANNLVTITKYLGTDPESSISNDVLYQGVDTGLLPLSRSFNLGVTINL
jgi:TonB-linked SusC/RagA family outer membrane protein